MRRAREARQPVREELGARRGVQAERAQRAVEVGQHGVACEEHGRRGARSERGVGRVEMRVLMLRRELGVGLFGVGVEIGARGRRRGHERAVGAACLGFPKE